MAKLISPQITEVLARQHKEQEILKSDRARRLISDTDLCEVEIAMMLSVSVATVRNILSHQGDGF